VQVAQQLPLPEAALTPDREPAGPGVHGRSGAGTYRQILRSSAIVGGSSVVSMAIGLVRTKAMALMLGPGGFGLMGALSTIADLARTIAELGINSSGVRQIAEAAGSGDARKIALTVTVLRRVVLVLGLLGGVLLALLAGPVATLTFGNEDHTWAVAVLGFAVLFRLVADGQGALLQGMRRIGDIARANVLGAVFGSALGILLVFSLRERGVALALVGVAAASLAVSWWHSRRVRVERPAMSWDSITQETFGLVRVGLAFMASAMLTMGAAYVVRIILIRSDGLEGAGLYQAAWAVGGLYVSFVLQAMGTDFYPRLVAAANVDAECNRLVNEQAMVSLLMAGVGVVATLTLAPWVVTLLYSAKFTAATELLRWVCLGMALRVITWPLGYILVAKGRQTAFVTADLLWTVVNVGLTWLFVRWFGLVGAGIAFFGSYLFHFFVVYPMCRRASGFRWSGAAAQTAAVFLVVIACVQAAFMLLEPRVAIAIGLFATVSSAMVSVLALRRLVSPGQLPKKLSWMSRYKRGEE
jgi:PST family polysaccharide transporter